VERRYRNGWWLEQKYWVEGLTQGEIAEECGVSARCIRKWMQKRGIEARELVGENHPLYGRERDEETKAKISESMQGREITETHRERIAEGHEGRTLPEAVRERISASLSGRTVSRSTRRRMSESTTGEANPNWQGGYSHRYGDGWSVCRAFVLDRDERCQACGHEGEDRLLDVHHSIPVRRFRQASDTALAEAHDPRNLVVLCRRCHPKADNGSLTFESEIDPPE
jgi:5-methylcytosine-specific restriction endonuclease McrA